MEVVLYRSKASLVQCSIVAFVLHAGCGSDDGSGTPGGSTDGVNVSEGRIKGVVNGLCKRWSRCDEDFEDDYGSVASCTDEELDDFDRPATAFENRCADSVLDASACIAQLGCDDDSQAECGELLDARWTACSQ